MIQTLRAKNYGCLLDVEAKLTPLHAFIGPNDSGKSTLLRAVRAVTRMATGPSEAPFDLGLDWDRPGSFLEAGLADGLCYRVTVEEGSKISESVLVPGRTVASQDKVSLDAQTLLAQEVDHPAFGKLREALTGARLLRLDPDALRRPSLLIASSARVQFSDERGAGLPAVYDALIDRDVEAFVAIVARVRALFRSVGKVGLTTVGPADRVVTEKALQVTLLDGRKVDAARVSEGLLYYLAFAALTHLDPVSVLLVEEPENGLHPSRIAEVMRILREVSRTTQVLLATHSPLVINELQPDEVSVVTRAPDEGTRITPIAQTHNFAKRSSVYALGELWLSYANGDDEAPLLQGRGTP